MDTDTNTSALFGLDGGSFDMPGGDQMDLFDFFINTNDLPDFITAPELPLPLPSSSETTPDSSPVPSPPGYSLGQDVIKNEPLSPGQASDGGSSGDEACYVELSKISPVKVEPNYQGFVNPASLDVKFCNEPLTANATPIPQSQQRRNLKRRRETSIKPTMAPDQLFPPGIDGAQKQVSPEEERELKKQKRLIKNRESAQKSRQRRKAYIEELEQKVATLAGQTEQLAQENKVLKEDLAYLLNVLKKTPGVPSEVLSKTSSLGVAPTAPVPIRGVKAAGVCLLIVLFSFGLFFNAKNGPSGPSLPFDPNTPREPIPEVLPSNHYDKRYTTRMLKSLKDAEFDERRELLEIFPERGGRHRRGITIKTEEVPVPPLTEQPLAQEIELQHTVDKPIKKEKSEDVQQVQQPRESPCIKKQKKSSNWTKTAVPMDISEDNIGLVPSRDGTFINPRTSYFFCSDAREVLVGDSDQSDQQPRTVSLLVPLAAFNGTTAEELRSHTSSDSPALVEVACQVLNMNVYTHAVANGTVSVS